jgi:hypothetical protein
MKKRPKYSLNYELLTRRKFEDKTIDNFFYILRGSFCKKAKSVYIKSVREPVGWG